MRSAFHKILVALPLIVAIRGEAQMNTNQPLPDCARNGSVYSPATNTCVTMGGTGSPINNPQYTGDMRGPTISSSVNTQINVMAPPYNAKGDCVTDDHNAIMAAQTAALAYAVGRTTSATLLFPKPPGGCYLTSTIHWAGVPLQGQLSGITSDYGSVIIQGKPGQDILAVPDPSVSTFTYSGAFAIENINFKLDDSVAGKFPHRWPGRWFDDAGMTAGSATFTSARAFISCGDIGQAIQVNGAGPNGANLVTTIQSVFPCWTTSGSVGNRWHRVTLADAASTTVSNAHAYISVAGFPVTTTIGAAAIAMDDKEGNKSKWRTPTQGTGGSGNIIRNVNFSSTSTTMGGKNNTVAMFTQGQAILYGLRVEHVNAQRLTFGFVTACAEFNSYQASCAGDYQQWNHMNLNGIKYPFIVYNGLENHYSDFQLLSSNGPQFLNLGNVAHDLNDNNFFENSGWEVSTMPAGTVGWRLEGQGQVMSGVTIGNSTPTYIDTNNLVCTNCLWWSNPLYLNGTHNRLTGSSGDLGSVVVVDGGVDNRISASYLASPSFSMPMNQPWSPIPTKGDLLTGRFTPDFLKDGNSTPYNLSDLMFWPKDVIFQGYGNPYSQYYQDDSTSPTGGYLIFKSGWNAGAFATLGHGGGAARLQPGINIPAAPTTIFFLAKCPSPGTLSMELRSGNGTSSALVSRLSNASCTTSWQQYSFRSGALPGNLGPTGGLSFQNPNSAPYYVAWIYARPDIADINGIPLANFATTDGSGNLRVSDSLATMPLYNTAGSQQRTPHMVKFSGQLSNGSFTVTLNRNAVFKGATTYTCNANDNTATNPIKVSYASGSSFTLTGTASDAFSGQCVGD